MVPHRWRRDELRSSSGVFWRGRTLACAVTHLPPGKHSCPAPRAAGVRALLEGKARFAASEGPAFGLFAHDVVRTRDIGAGVWDVGESGAMWLDVVDAPLVSALGAENGVRLARRNAGTCAFAERSACRTPPRVHRWSQTRLVLERAAAEGSSPGIARFGSPRSGGDLSSTVRAEVHRIEAGRSTPSVRANQSAVAVVLAGSGSSVVAARRLCWERGDVLALPPGAPVEHHAHLTADLLIVSDAPALAALGLWWTETVR